MNKSKKQLYAYPAMMVLAIYATVLGLMIPEIRAAFSLTYAQVGLFATLQGIGMAVSITLVFSVFSAYNSIKVSGLSMIGFAAIMVLVGISENLVLLYFLFFLIGLFQNTIDALANTVISETATTRVSFYIGLMHALWAFAGVIGPFLALALGGQYKVVFIWMGVAMAAVSLAFIFGLKAQIRMPMIQNPDNMGGLGKLGRILKRKGMVSLTLTNVFNCFTMNTFIILIASYFGELHDVWYSGALMISCLFLGLLVGRVVFSILATRIPVLKTMAITNAFAVVAFVLMMLSTSLPLAATLCAIGSLFISLNFPALILESHKLVPDDVSAASALIYIGLVIAIFIAPAIIGAIGDAAGLKLALIINSLMLIPVVILCAKSSKTLDAL